MNDYKYLGIIPRKLDPAQSNVCFTNNNAVIAAGAGSGKTQVLATRFAWLVISQKVKASEILTLTFTNKAASEMYQRIYNTLKYFADYKVKSDEELVAFFAKNRKIENPSAEELAEFREAEADLTEEKKSLAQEALDDFNNVHIQTLDSYCGGIVRQCSNRYGIQPDFSVGSADGEREIKNLVFKKVLKHADEDVVTKLAEPGKMQEFAEDFISKIIIEYTSVATPKNYFKDKFARQLKEIISAWNYYVLNDGTQLGIFTSGMGGATSAASGASSIENIMCNANNALVNSGNSNDPAKATFVKNFLDAKAKSDEFVVFPKLSQEMFTGSKMDQRVYEQINFLEEFLKMVNSAYDTKGSIKNVTDELLFLCGSNSSKAKTKIIVNSLLSFLKEYSETYELMLLLDEICESVNLSKRKTGKLSFKDVTELALKVVMENPDIRSQENSAYKKIMIDEFQDNNSKNRDLLYLLSLKEGEFENQILTEDEISIHNQIVCQEENKDCRKNDKLFFVGDEKQSIYKFRGADVSVFNELTKENQKVVMSYNYRSTPELIQAFNYFFKNGNGIFEAPSNNQFEASYTNDACKFGMEKLPALTPENVPIHLRMLNEANLKNQSQQNPVHFLPKEEQIAYDIARTIYEISVEEGAANNPSYNWNKFAILDRSRTNRNLLTKYLSLFNIPFEVDQFKNIFEDGVINDFYNFLRICVYPSNINSFAAYLCSPLCGLSENAAEIILAHLTVESQGNYDFVFNPFETKYDDFIKSDLEKLAQLKGGNHKSEFETFINGRQFFLDNKKKVLQQQITSTISMLWHKRGYKYETLLSVQAKLCSEHFDMLFELARLADNDEKSVSWFIDELEDLKKASSKNDSEIDASSVTYPLERIHAVQIMTIHKSKGLQFDYVFLYGLIGCKLKGDTNHFFFDEEVGVTTKLNGSNGNYFFIKQKDEAEKKELAEFRRLIYVGVTRAIQQVYFFGIIPEKEYSSANLRLIKNMAEKAYPEFDVAGKYMGKPVFNDNLNAFVAFDFQEITPMDYSCFNVKTGTVDSVRSNLILNAMNNYEEGVELAQAYPSDYPRIERKNPSKLGKDKSDGSNQKTAENQQAGNPQIDGSQTAGSHKINLYSDLTDILSRYSPTAQDDEDEETRLLSLDDEAGDLPSVEFKATDFGTLIHDYLCKMILGIEPEKYEPEKRLFKNLKAEDIKKIRQICVKMCNQFKNTKLFQDLAKCKEAELFFYPEYEFKMFQDRILYRGSIDLIFENIDGSFTIIDYKTDKKIRPEEHYKQLACYKEAAEDLLPHEGKIRSYLYYLRFDEVVEIK